MERTSKQIGRIKTRLTEPFETMLMVFAYRIKNAEDWKYFRAQIRDKTLPFDHPDLHGHTNKNTFRVLQYGVYQGHAALMAYKNGCDLLRLLMQIGELPEHLQLLHSPPILLSHTFGFNAKPNTFLLERFVIPENKLYKLEKCTSIYEKINLIEQTIASALVSWAGELGYFIEPTIKVQVIDYFVWQEKNDYKAKRNDKEANRPSEHTNGIKPVYKLLDVKFKTCFHLPPFFSIGSEKASGYGWASEITQTPLNLTIFPKYEIYVKK